MGEFNASKYIVGLLIYFFIEFLVIFAILQSSSVTGLATSGVFTSDPGFVTSNLTGSELNATVNPSGLATGSVVFDTIRFMFGLETGLGVPGSYRFIFFTFFTLIPLIALILSMYFLIPVIH